MIKVNISYNYKIFINNIRVKELKIKYNNQKVLSEVCYYIFEYLQILNRILLILKLANAKISEEKLHFDQADIVIVEYTCDYSERHSEVVKITKILD